ncbi:MAG: endospore germination permease [Eubacteriales bacterium]|nr:endospore germination permease [Eubacteriales bacterium]
MPKQVLSPKQFAAILYIYVLGAALLFIPEAYFAGKDAWISTLLGSAISMLVLAAWLRLARRHPGKSPVQIGIKVLGPVFGYPLGLYSLLIIFVIAALIVQNMVLLNNIAILRKTPIDIIRITLVATALYACSKGIETIGRICELMFLPLTLLVFSLAFLDYPQLSVRNLQPLWQINWRGVLVGTLNSLAFPFAEIFTPAMLLPNVTPEGKGEKYYYLVLAVAGILLLGRTLLGIVIFSAPILELIAVPFFSLFRHVAFGQFFDRTEGLFLGLFYFGILIKLIISLYALALGTAQIFGVRRLNNLWLPLGFLVVLMSHTMFPNDRTFYYFASMVHTIFALPIELIYPLLLVGADVVRGRLQPGPVEKSDGNPEQS